MAGKEELYLRSDGGFLCKYCSSPHGVPRNLDELIVHYETVHNYSLVKKEKGIEGGIIEVAYLEREGL